MISKRRLQWLLWRLTAVLIFCGFVGYILFSKKIAEDWNVITKLKIYTFNYGEWERNLTVCQADSLQRIISKHYFQRSFIQSRPSKIELYTNDPEEDQVISREIHRHHTYEPWVFNTIYKHIMKDPEIGIIDMGANLGISSFQFANIGRKVISVEPTYQCVQHLCASIVVNSRFTNYITIVHNAMSNNHEDVAFILPNKGEFGLGYVKQKGKSIGNDMAKTFGKETYKSKSILLKSTTFDDFLSLQEFQAMPKVFVKMDIQGYEYKAIEGFEKVYRTGKLVGLYLEWTWHRNRTSGDNLIRKLTQWGFEPYFCNDVLKEIASDLNKPCSKVNVKQSEIWGDDILWLPKS